MYLFVEDDKLINPDYNDKIGKSPIVKNGNEYTNLEYNKKYGYACITQSDIDRAIVYFKNNTDIILSSKITVGDVFYLLQRKHIDVTDFTTFMMLLSLSHKTHDYIKKRLNAYHMADAVAFMMMRDIVHTTSNCVERMMMIGLDITEPHFLPNLLLRNASSYMPFIARNSYRYKTLDILFKAFDLGLSPYEGKLSWRINMQCAYTDSRCYPGVMCNGCFIFQDIKDCYNIYLKQLTLFRIAMKTI